MKSKLRDKFYPIASCWNPPKGALVFFSASGEDQQLGHIGIYLGNGKIVHAYKLESSDDFVREESISDVVKLPNIVSYEGWAYPLENWLSIPEEEYTERYTLVTSVSPPAGGDVDLAPSGGTYDKGSQVTLTAIQASGYTFDHWGDDASGTSLSVNITMDSNKNIVAYFVEVPMERYSLTIYVEGGGDINPSGGSYDEGDKITLRASPHSGWEFDRWDGTDDNSANPTTVTMNSDRTVTAYFESIMPDFVWTRGTDLPQATTWSAVAVVSDRIYVMGGNYHVSNYRYDFISNGWTTKAELPGNGVNEGGAAVVNNKIYVIGPSDYNVMIYDPSSDSWTTGAELPTRRRGIGVVAANDKVYAIGGTDGQLNGYNTVEEYDPSSNTWARKADMPTARGFAAVCILDNLVYVIGGRDSGSYSEILNTVEVYDPITDSWSTGTSMPTSRSGAAIGVIDGKIYVIGGFNGSYLTKVEEYDPAEDVWTIKNPISVPRSGAVAGVVNSKIYIIGGNNDSGVLATVKEGEMQ